MFRRRLVSLVVLLILMGCGGDATPSDGAYDDRELARALLAGWSAPETMYDLTGLTCEKLDDRILLSATVVNRNADAWAFGQRWTVVTSQGEVRSETTHPGFFATGEDTKVTNWFGRPEDFDDEPTCEVEILHGTALAFQSGEKQPQIYETLGWDPAKEKRID